MFLTMPDGHGPFLPYYQPTLESPKQIQHLLSLLRRLAGRDETPTFGGIQHLLNRISSTSSQGPALPDSILLTIFSHLTALELGHAAQVCSQWNRVAEDELLWRFRLQRDQSEWQFLGHEANPDLFEATHADLGNKERYLRCSPQFQSTQKSCAPEPVLSRLLPALLRRAWPPTPPKLALLGPGLDDGCSGLARKLLTDPEGRFKIGKPFPGLNGVGSGFEFTLTSPDNAASQQNFALSLLYSGPKAERERGGVGRLFEKHPEGTRLSHVFKEQCASLDSLIYIVDASVTPQDHKIIDSRQELAALAAHCWGMKGGKMPLLVMAMMPSGKSERVLSCLDVIRNLDLNNIRLPWRVYAARVESANSIIEGLQWQLDKINQNSV